MASRKRDVLPEEYANETFKLVIQIQEDPQELDDVDELELEIKKYDMLIKQFGKNKGE